MFRLIAKIALVILLTTGVYADNPHTPHGPVVVAEASVSGGSAGVSGTLITPVADTTYLVAVSVVVRGSNSTGNSAAACNIFYTGSIGSSFNTTFAASASSGLTSDQVRYIIVTAGNPVTYSCTYTPQSSSDLYDMSIVVLQL